MNRLTRSFHRPTPATAPTTRPMPTQSAWEGRTALLASVGLSKRDHNAVLGGAAHKFIEGMALDLQERRLLSDHCCKKNTAVLALMQDLRPDFVPVLSLMPPDDTSFDERAQRTIESLKAAVELELAFEVHLGDVPVTGAVMDALENAMTAPGARITAFHFESPWAEDQDGRFVHQALLQRLSDSLKGCASLQEVRGGMGVLWLLDRPVEHLSIVSAQPPRPADMAQLKRVLGHGVGRFTCASDDVRVFPAVTGVVRAANTQASAATAVQAVTLHHPYRAPRGPEGAKAVDDLLHTPHLKRLMLPASEWLNALGDHTLTERIGDTGLQALDFGDGLGGLSLPVMNALAANAATPANPPRV